MASFPLCGDPCCSIGCVNTFHTHSDHSAFIRIYDTFGINVSIYLFEDISLGEAFAKTFRLGFATWGGVFLILIVMGIIASVLQGIVSIPWYVIYIVKMIFTMSDGGATSSSVGLNFGSICSLS